MMNNKVSVFLLTDILFSMDEKVRFPIYAMAIQKNTDGMNKSLSPMVTAMSKNKLVANENVIKNSKMQKESICFFLKCLIA